MPDQILRYKIEITKIEHFKIPAVRNRLVEKTHYTDKEIEEHRYMRTDGVDSVKYMKERYEEIETTKWDTSSEKIYTQEVEQLDIAAIIIAINTPRTSPK